MKKDAIKAIAKFCLILRHIDEKQNSPQNTTANLATVRKGGRCRMSTLFARTLKSMKHPLMQGKAFLAVVNP